MKILIVGAGGREHALAWKCRQSEKFSGVFVTPGNDGIKAVADCWGLTGHQCILEQAIEHQVDIVVVGQEDYLINGLKEQLEQVGIQVVGPGKMAARLEGSKVFAKQFMVRHGIPTAPFQVFEREQDALNFLSTKTFPVVIKADGLAAGKGVQICDSLDSATAWITQLMSERRYGEAGQAVVIEDFLPGKEVSWFVLSDGEFQKELIPLQDYKKQLDGGNGPNTGGMGCYAPVSFIDEKMAEEIRNRIVIPTFNGLKEEGFAYQGVLYFGLMIGQDGPKLLEYNVRFGDPECQTLMALLKTDLFEIFNSILTKKLEDQEVQWKNGHAVTVILASEHYPNKGSNQAPIDGLENLIETKEAVAFHAATVNKNNRFYTNGGRVLGVTAIGDSLSSAKKLSYQMVEKVFWEGMQFRKDIACIERD